MERAAVVEETVADQMIVIPVQAEFLDLVNDKIKSIDHTVTFMAFLEEGETNLQLCDIVVWGKAALGKSFSFSSEVHNSHGTTATFWIKGKFASQMFAIRWMNR